MFALFAAAGLLLTTISHSGYADAAIMHPRIPNQPGDQKPTICRIFEAIPNKLSCEAIGYTFELQVDKAGKKACCHECFYNTNMVIICPKLIKLV